MIKMETSMGTLMIELDEEKAPVSAKNFQDYVVDGFFDGLIFHRVIPGFMVQGGGFDLDMSQKPGKKPIQNEADNGLKNDKYTLAMARTQDPHSASSQFFINVADNEFLNHTAKNVQGWGYAVFGKVVEGMDVCDAIAQVSTGTRGYHQDVPDKAVTIIKAEVV